VTEIVCNIVLALPRGYGDQAKQDTCFEYFKWYASVNSLTHSQFLFPQRLLVGLQACSEAGENLRRSCAIWPLYQLQFCMSLNMSHHTRQSFDTVSLPSPDKELYHRAISGRVLSNRFFFPSVRP